ISAAFKICSTRIISLDNFLVRISLTSSLTSFNAILAVERISANSCLAFSGCWVNNFQQDHFLDQSKIAYARAYRGDHEQYVGVPQILLIQIFFPWQLLIGLQDSLVYFDYINGKVVAQFRLKKAV